MPYGIPQGFGRVTYVFATANTARESITQIGIEAVSVPDTTEANAFFTAFETHVMPILSNECALVRAEVLVNIGGDFYEGLSDELPAAGSIVSPMSVVHTALLYRKVTGLVGRDRVGRGYVPGAADTSVDAAGFLVGDLIDDWPAAVEALYNEITTGTIDSPVVLLHAPVEGEPDPEPTPVTGFVASQKVGTQRRRLR